MDIRIPDNVNMILEKLNSAGYEAFVVGGCVRDTFMGKSPNDWDICTSARPNEIKECFGEFPTVDTGIKHGTVTVIVAGRPVEVTTYRIDGEYHDNRHPVSVEFTENIEADLARRDFTVNAMAYSPVLGVFDPFGGRQDIKGKCIRCVGKPILRFEEDALRIMRGLRFASVLGFDIEEETLTAMRACKDLMKKVSVERIHVEFSKLIMGKNADLILENCRDILQAVIPEMADGSVGNLPLNLINRLGALFPEDTEAVLRRLKYDNYTIKQTLLLNDIKRRYGAKTVEKVEILKILKNYGEDTARLYFEEYGGIDELNRAMGEGACWKRTDLQVSGRDVMEAGFRKGPEIGEVLNELLEQVIEGKLENERKMLMEALMFKKERKLQ